MTYFPSSSINKPGFLPPIPGISPSPAQAASPPATGALAKHTVAPIPLPTINQSVFAIPKNNLDAEKIQLFKATLPPLSAPPKALPLGTSNLTGNKGVKGKITLEPINKGNTDISADFAVSAKKTESFALKNISSNETTEDNYSDDTFYPDESTMTPPSSEAPSTLSMQKAGEQSFNTQLLATSLLKDTQQHHVNTNNMTTFQSIRSFVNVNLLKELQFPKEDYDRAMDAMMKISSAKRAPADSPLSDTEKNLVNFYTLEEGYTAINSTLSGNLEEVATQHLNNLCADPKFDIKALAKNQNEVQGLQAPLKKTSILGVAMKDGQAIVTVLNPGKGLVKFEMNDQGNAEILRGLKNGLIQAHALNGALEKLPAQKYNVLYRRIPLDPKNMDDFIGRYNRGRELPLGQTVNVVEDNIIVQENRVTSTSTDKEVTKKFGGEKGFVEFRIKTEEGRDIDGYSNLKEGEVLLLPNSKLQVQLLKKVMVTTDDGEQVESLIIIGKQVNTAKPTTQPLSDKPAEGISQAAISSVTNLNFNSLTQVTIPSDREKLSKSMDESLFPTLLNQVTVMNQVKLGGSTGAKLVEGERGVGGQPGPKYVMKSSETIEPDHLRSEYHTNKAYKLLGVPVPEVMLYHKTSSEQIKDPNKKVGEDKPVMLSKFIPNAISLEDHLDLIKGDKQAQKMVQDVVKKHFVADCLLANWDVAGISNDNMLIDKQGKVWRIDNGSGLDYRAQGGIKSQNFFTPEIKEFDSLRNPNINENTAFLFSTVTNEEIIAQINDIQKIGKEEFLKTMPDRLKEIMGARFEYLETYKNQLK
jgi:hypothetical protein